MAKQRITHNTDATITPSKAGGPGSPRNSLSRVFLEDGEDFQVIVKTDTDETVVAKGRAKAASGKYCSIYVKVRAEADVSEPKAEKEEL